MSDFTSNFWSVYVAGISILGIVFCAALLWFSGRIRVNSASDNTTGHVWDEDLAELNNPRDVVPESNMPAYSWLMKNNLEPASIQPRMKALRTVGVPYTDEEIAKAPEQLKDKTEMDAVVAYLQSLGLALK